MAVATHSERPPTPPINKLVDDTLLITLDFCVFPNQPISCQKALVAFSQVCRRWRKVVLEYPRPWSYIKLTGKEDFESLLDRWIERSQKHPLDVEVIALSSSCTLTHSQCRILDQLVTSDIARICSLDINSWTSQFDCFSMGRTFPILTSLSLSVNLDVEETQGLLNFPTLKVLNLSNAACLLIQQFKVPMKLLTDLTIAWETAWKNVFVSWPTFLESCPQLTVFKLIADNVTLVDNASPKPAERLILYNLTHLTVVLKASANQNLSLLENIRAPLLQYFHFEGPDDRSYSTDQLQSDNLFAVLLPIIENCQETLLELSLQWVHFSVIQATALLGYGKHIKKLDITHSSLLPALEPIKLLMGLAINCETIGQNVSRCACPTFLENYPQLTVFNLAIHGVILKGNASVMPAEPLILHNLTHLTVVLKGVQAYANQNLSLLKNIQAPFLQYFYFEGPDYEHQLQSDALFDALLSIIESCQETLLELSLQWVNFSVVQATALLGYGKHIKKLDITHFSLLQALVLPFGSHPTNWLCPYLQELTACDDCAVIPNFIDLLTQRASTMPAPYPNYFRCTTRITLYGGYKYLVVFWNQVNEI